jgi:redox-sensing transcriptional repressor
MTPFSHAFTKLSAAGSEKTVGRLSLYRRLLERLLETGKERVFSHELAKLAGVTAAQVRRDLMGLNVFGNPALGYNVRELIREIGNQLDADAPEGIALIGVGHLGRAVLAYFQSRRPNLEVRAAFDVDPTKVGRVIQGCHSYPLEELESVVRDQAITLAIIAAPASAAQDVANRLVRAGVHGILNFAPISLRVPEHVRVDDLDLTMALEKVAYFARKGLDGKAVGEGA